MDIAAARRWAKYAADVGRKVAGAHAGPHSGTFRERAVRYGEHLASEGGKTQLAKHGLKTIDRFLSGKLRTIAKGTVGGLALSFAIGLARDHIQSHVHRLGREQHHFENTAKVLRGDTEHIPHGDLRHVREHADTYGGPNANEVRQKSAQELKHREDVRRQEKFARERQESQIRHKDSMAKAKAQRRARYKDEDKHAETVTEQSKERAKETVKARAKEGRKQSKITHKLVMSQREALHEQKQRHLGKTATPHAPGVGAGVGPNVAPNVKVTPPNADAAKQAARRQNAARRIAEMRSNMRKGKPITKPATAQHGPEETRNAAGQKVRAPQPAGSLVYKEVLVHGKGGRVFRQRRKVRVGTKKAPTMRRTG